eukprot:CAMPEP_0194479376 /NCGR_PEP_ID=MMETSP0253-20130528/2522_1 /TAXON_ID=2966 /ORGANISM="Noctiluca scintillans" /LENGTH=57 /DNA_ID=CAMNT_0039318593 /DNA_START=30 /DNA_END=200 /DNA_ORIENTATION=+
MARSLSPGYRPGGARCRTASKPVRSQVVEAMGEPVPHLVPWASVRNSELSSVRYFLN